MIYEIWEMRVNNGCDTDKHIHCIDCTLVVRNVNFPCSADTSMSAIVTLGYP